MPGGGLFSGQRAHLWILHNCFSLASTSLSSGLCGKFVIDFLFAPFFWGGFRVLLAFCAALSAFPTQPSKLHKLLILNENNNMYPNGKGARGGRREL